MLEPNAMHKQPTNDLGFESGWGPSRRRLAYMISSKNFDLILSITVLSNIGLLVIETDSQSQKETVADWVTIANRVLLAFYVLELVVRMFVYRCLFFIIPLNWLDLIIVCGDGLIEIIGPILGGSEQLPSVVILRAFKLTRLTRSRRVLRLFPELYLMVIGLGAALKAIFWGMFLLVIVLIIWGILAVQLIHPLAKTVQDRGGFGDCDRCSRSFETVPAAVLTFMQHLIAGDSWGTVSIPIVEMYPATIIFFFGVISTVSMVVLNLILAVVVDGAADARKQTDHEFAKEKEKDFERAKKQLMQICARLDTDNSGSLTLQELEQGFCRNTQFQDAMKVLDLHNEDMGAVFAILDEDKSGTVNYEEFVEQLYKMRANDSHTMLVFIKFYVTEMRHSMLRDLKMVLEGVAGLERKIYDEAHYISQEVSELEDAMGKEIIRNAKSEDIVELDQANETTWTHSRLTETLQELLACIQSNERVVTSVELTHTATKVPANGLVRDCALQALPATNVVGPYSMPLPAPQKKKPTTPPAPAELLCGGCMRPSKNKGTIPSDAPGQRTGAA